MNNKPRFTEPLLSGGIWRIAGTTKEICVVGSRVDTDGKWNIEYIDANGEVHTMRYTPEEWAKVAQYVGTFEDRQ